MDFPQALSEQLSALTDALDEPGTDLQAVLAVLFDDLTAAVPSFLGLIMTMHLDGYPITLTAIDTELAAAAGASLQLPLDPLAGAGPGSTVVFYAGNPGAFIDLAAEARHAYGLDGQVVLDGHGTFPTTGPPGVGGLDDLTVINKAVGVLIDQGHSPDQARDELFRRAGHHQHRLPDAARYLLTATARAEPRTAADS